MNVVDKFGNTIDVGDIIEYYSEDGVIEARVTKIVRTLKKKWVVDTRQYKDVCVTRVNVYPITKSRHYDTSLTRLDRTKIIKKFEEDI